MGHGIAQVAATAGYNIVLRDIEQKFLDKAMEKIKWSLDKLASKEKISQQEADSIYSRIKPVVDLLLGEKSKRPFNYTVAVTNSDAIDLREEEKKQKVMKVLHQMFSSS